MLKSFGNKSMLARRREHRVGMNFKYCVVTQKRTKLKQKKVSRCEKIEKAKRKKIVISFLPVQSRRQIEEREKSKKISTYFFAASIGTSLIPLCFSGIGQPNYPSTRNLPTDSKHIIIIHHYYIKVVRTPLFCLSLLSIQFSSTFVKTANHVMLSPGA